MRHLPNSGDVRRADVARPFFVCWRRGIQIPPTMQDQNGHLSVPDRAQWRVASVSLHSAKRSGDSDSDTLIGELPTGLEADDAQERYSGAMRQFPLRPVEVEPCRPHLSEGQGPASLASGHVSIGFCFDPATADEAECRRHPRRARWRRRCECHATKREARSLPSARSARIWVEAGRR
jgi:hypothetical protein